MLGSRCHLRRELRGRDNRHADGYTSLRTDVLGVGRGCAPAGVQPCVITATAGQLVTAAFRNPANAVATFYHTDVLGSVRAITSATGGTVATYDYLPFGESTVPPATDSRRFTGKERDAETAFDYFGTRYYRNVWGRFTSVDPVMDLENLTTVPQRWNRYAYSLNSPMRFVDPDGRNPFAILGVIGSVVFGGTKVFENVQNGKEWYDGLGIAMGEGLLVGATLGLATPAIVGTTAGVEFGTLTAASSAGVEGIRFAQKGVSPFFAHGEFAGKSLNSVADGLRSGTISPDLLPLQTVVRDGIAFTMNNRSLLALRMAAKLPTRVVDVTGVAQYERTLTQRLGEIGKVPSLSFTPFIRGPR